MREIMGCHYLATDAFCRKIPKVRSSHKSKRNGMNSVSGSCEEKVSGVSRLISKAIRIRFSLTWKGQRDPERHFSTVVGMHSQRGRKDHWSTFRPASCGMDGMKATKMRPIS